MNQAQKVLVVALPTPLRRNFDYLLPDDLESSPPQIGTRVEVNFAGRSLVGVVIDTQSSSSAPIEKLKPVSQALDNHPSLPPELVQLCKWASDYYLHPLGEVLNASLPPGLRDASPEPKQFVWKHTTEGLGLAETALKRSAKQQEIHGFLLKNGALSAEEIKQYDFSKSALKSLSDKKLIEQREIESFSVSRPLQILRENPLTLNEEQRTAVLAIKFHDFNTYLLEGATGSGKTEVYMQLAASALQSGKQVLVLIPEIGLSAQTIGRFKRRFDVNIVELHSNISDAERTRSWIAARDGRARIVIGTRLAALAAMKDIGLIIIDEEHDASYKQQDNFKYSARDISIWRAAKNRIPIVLGSATPSLESLNNVSSGKFQRLELKTRAGGAQPPELIAIDLKGQLLEGGLTTYAVQEIESTLRSGGQALVFLNRRGYAPFLLCHHCGWTSECRNCSSSMTLHQRPKVLHCHHCDRRASIPRQCPSCNAEPLQPKGLGTEQSENLLNERFRDYPVVRIDRDSTRTKSAMEDALSEIRKGDPCLLVGTQMLAKGHHLPNLRLVVMLDADQGLLSPEFRAAERMGQLLTQVSGRAGREKIRGKVLIQTHRPDHPYLQMLINDGYSVFAQHLLEERQISMLPPYWHMATFRAESKRAENAMDLLKFIEREYRKRFPPHPGISYLGPIPANIEKINERFRFQLQFKAVSRAELKKVLKVLVEDLSSSALAKRTRWSLDVDPID